MWTKREIAEAVRYEGGITRRLMLAQAASLAALPWLGTRAEGAVKHRPRLADNPFTVGVASGDPGPDGMVLWTRLAPCPLEPFGGMDPEPVEVRWELAEDEGFTKIVTQGNALATPQLGHSVHVETRGLPPDRIFFYRFLAGDATSPVGRTRTLPAPNAAPERLRFAFASCQHYETGLYTSYEHMAKDDLDLIFHLGDYIYEYAGRDNLVRKHAGPEITTLEDYRIRHAQYKTDPHLQAAHALCPWFVTWDDHEFDNNYANDISEEPGVDPVAFLTRRANAYQAYYEMMPLRKRSVPRGPDMRLYRRAAFGRLAELLVLDTRQYRSDQPNNDGLKPLNDAALDPKQTILGRAQKGWLMGRLLESQATWNVLAQQVMMAMVGFVLPIDDADAEPRYAMDQWPGYTHERMELIRFLAERRVPNPVVLTGDIHSNWVNELRVDDRRHDDPVVAAEFVCTSISSGGNGPKAANSDERMNRMKSINPGVKFFNAQRGYVRVEVTPEVWRSDYQVVEDVTKPGAPVVTKGSFVVQAGRPGIESA